MASESVQQIDKKSKKRKRAEAEAEESPAAAAREPKSKEKRKKNKLEAPVETAVDLDQKSDRKKHKSKRKDRKDPEVDAESEPPAATDVEAEPAKKKSKKNKTGFPDPEEDSALSEQASKALSYAFYRFRKPSKWKFSKAKQNWLTRNFWSESAIPESHVPLVTKYLSNVQGGVRENLLKNCQSILSPASEPPAETETKTPAPDVLKQTRAQLLLDSLEAATQESSTAVET
ncbi:unnamed protein product [Mycena citricolor]|uniref:WKF domain-containing protein n=1 Tax=Mycena citricolor TaxID=2018698 RepID=A0AAD2K349_9AGAR|nr:unnamed protein product [Mycena citricolor]